MADSVGAGFPTTGIQRGHIFFDLDTQLPYVFIGGNAADVANWLVLNIGALVIPPIVQRWHWQASGFEVSTPNDTPTGATEMFFVMPSDGRLVKWGIVIGSVSAPFTTNFRLVADPFVTFAPFEFLAFNPGDDNMKLEATFSRSVLAGDVIMVNEFNVYNPANTQVRLSGYIDFLPNV